MRKRSPHRQKNYLRGPLKAYSLLPANNHVNKPLCLMGVYALGVLRLRFRTLSQDQHIMPMIIQILSKISNRLWNRLLYHWGLLGQNTHRHKCIIKGLTQPKTMSLLKFRRPTVSFSSLPLLVPVSNVYSFLYIQMIIMTYKIVISSYGLYHKYNLRIIKSSKQS